VTRSRSGFTLIELVVSAVLLALLSAGVAMVISVCLGAWKAGQARAESAQQTEAVLGIVGRDLRAAFIGRRGFFVSRDDGGGRCYLELTTLSRRSQRLLYLAERGETPGENLSDLAQVVYFTEPSEDGQTFALYRQEICPPEPQPLDEQGMDMEKAQLLCDNAVSFALRFWDGQSAADWLPEWSLLTGTSAGLSTQSALPGAAEIALTLKDSDRERSSLARVPVSMGYVSTGGTAQ